MSYKNTVNLMIVDDSRVMRNLLTQLVSADPLLNVVSTAANGQEAIDELKAKLNDIDVILLDLNMPLMDGMQALPLLLQIKPKVKIIIVSTLTSTGTKYTLDALSLGASDYIEKPNENTSLEHFSKELLSKIHSFAILHITTPSTTVQGEHIQKEEVILKTKASFFRPQLIAIASSTGGPRALLEVLGGWSKEFLNSHIILITQHIRNDFVDLLVENINSIDKLHCKKAENGELLKKGNIYLAPSDHHMEVCKIADQLRIHLSNSPPENFCRPSADPMFNSIAKLNEKALGIVLTGIGSDGLIGATALAEKDNVIIAQDKETSVVWGMPGSVATAGICSAVLPLYKIASYVEKDL